jgi:predicted transcriptional regulator
VAGDQDAQITVRIPSAIRKRLDILAAKEKRKSSDLIRFALEEYVAREAIGPSGNPEKAALIEWVNRLRTAHPDLFRAFLLLSKTAEDPAVYGALVALGSLAERALGPRRGSGSRSAR